MFRNQVITNKKRKQIEKTIDSYNRFIPRNYSTGTGNFSISFGVFGINKNMEKVMEISKVIDFISLISSKVYNTDHLGLTELRKHVEFRIVYFPKKDKPFQLMMYSDRRNGSNDRFHKGRPIVGKYKGKSLLDIVNKILGLLLLLNKARFLNHTEYIKDFWLLYESELNKPYQGLGYRYKDERKNFEIEDVVRFEVADMDWKEIQLDEIESQKLEQIYMDTIEYCDTVKIDNDLQVS